MAMVHDFKTPQTTCREQSGQYPPNGLTDINPLDMDTQMDQRMIVIVYSEPAKSSAEEFRDEMHKAGQSASLLCLTAPKDLKDKIQLDSVTGLYMVVDPSLFDLLFQKNDRGLHSEVHDFMDELKKAKKYVNLLNTMDKRDRRFKKLFHHLPEKCAKIVTQITVHNGKVKDVSVKSSVSDDSGIADVSLTEVSKLNSADRASDSITKNNYCPSSEERATSDQDKADPGGDREEIKDVNSGRVKCFMESASGGAIAFGSDREESHGIETEQNEDEYLSEESDESEPYVDVNAVMIGYNQTMEVQWTAGQMVNASQEGWNNTMEINIVPSPTRSKVIMVFTSNTTDENLDKLLVREITDETELICVRFEDLDASNVKVSSGSVIIELEVKPGVTIDNAYIQKIMKAIFSGKAGKVIPEATKFGVDIQTKMVVPFEQLGQYLHLNPEKIHENCVSKEKYEEKVKEVYELKSRLERRIQPWYMDTDSPARMPSDHTESTESGIDGSEESETDSSQKSAARRVMERFQDLDWYELLGSMYCNKALISGVPELKSYESLQTYLEGRTGKDVSQILYGEAPGMIVVSFAVDSDGLDVAEFKRQLARKAFIHGGRSFILQATPVPQTKSVTVHNIPYGISEDTLELYFENRRRSRGGEVEKVMLNSDQQYAVVTFLYVKVAEAVSQREHTINGVRLQVHLCFKQLGEKGGSFEPPVASTHKQP